MTGSDWNSGYARSLAVFLNGDAITEPARHGEKIRDDDFLLLFNAHSEPVRFTLPGGRFGRRWEVVLDTAGAADGERPAAATIQLAARSMIVLRRIAGPAGRAP